MRTLAVTGGWLLAAAIVWLSLTPKPPDPGFAYGDKVGHFVAYATLMLWFAALYRGPMARTGYALLWIAMGVALELAQGAGGARAYELADMATNALGVLAGAAAALSLPTAAREGERETP